MIILASKSPRRKMLLSKLGLDFEVKESNVKEDEIKMNFSDPKEIVMKLAELKTEDVAKNNDGLIIGADTIVVLNNEIIGKANNDEHAKELMTKLNGKIHEVYTGICIIDTNKQKKIIDFEKSEVTLRNLTEKEIDDYIATELYKGKAGAYNIDDKEFKIFVKDVKGSETNIIGLPVEKVKTLLSQFGITV